MDELANIQIINPDLIELNKNEAWEQVFYFLLKKDKKIEKLKEYFWNKLIPVLEIAFLKEEKLSELVIDLKKNKDNTNYTTIKLTKAEKFIGKKQIEGTTGESDENFEDAYRTVVIWLEDNEEVTVDYLKGKWTCDDIIVFENNLFIEIEKLHLNRNKTIKELISRNEYLKLQLNPNPCHGIHI